ncbi:hypothetical protein [Streptomyces tanashiensis]|uniref:hypothetical protein n=1 Tax=Streptomyces tanashiensis TaxID=67367 RepID=UPI0033E44444
MHPALAPGAPPHAPRPAGGVDPDGRMLNRFRTGLPNHLKPGGEAWLILPDLAERLGLRGRTALEEAGVVVPATSGRG